METTTQVVVEVVYQMEELLALVDLVVEVTEVTNQTTQLENQVNQTLVVEVELDFKLSQVVVVLSLLDTNQNGHYHKVVIECIHLEDIGTMSFYKQVPHHLNLNKTI